MIIKNKRAIGYTEVIFILLNLMIFSFILIFISNSSSNASIYEQTYAKQIALIIDYAKPNMTVTLDVEEGVNILEKNKFDLEKAFRIDSNAKEVIVKLSKNGGYSFNYISDFNVSFSLVGGNLTIIIK